MRTAQNILILEDDRSISRALAIDLEHTKLYHCTIASTPEEALAILNQGHEFSTILVDIMMPGHREAGIDYIQSIKNNVNWKKIPVIVLSGLDNSEIILKALAVGAIDYLTKPYEKEELLERIKRASPMLQSSDHNEVRQLHLNLMKYSLLYWEITTGLNKADLAQLSGFWTTTVEPNGTTRTRTMDRYLDLKQMPQKPKTGLVIRTAQFVLDYSSSEQASELKSTIHGFMAQLEDSTP